MDERETLSALRSVGFVGHRAVAIPGGWANWTFEVDGAWIARFPRTAEIAESTRRELALLPELALHVSFAVPSPTHTGVWRGEPFMLYPRLDGRSMTPGDATPHSLEALGAMLAELHSFPIDRASSLLEAGPPDRAWARHYDALWPTVERLALPAMPNGLASRVTNEFQEYVSEHLDVAHCLVHNDLGLEHLLVDDETRRSYAMIDFEDAWIGDPAVDLVPGCAAFGRDALVPLGAGRDLGDRLAERMRFYRWMSSVHAIIHGVMTRSEREVESGIRELQARLDAVE